MRALSRRDWTPAAVLAGFILLSAALFGVRLLPHPGRSYIGWPVDPQVFIWSFAWWPHAIAHGLNPFYSHAVWAPDGVNLAWTATTPLLALVFSPVTALVGPVASYDLAMIVMPALAAWTAFLLCRHLTRSVWPALVGGYLFGFSSYMIGQLDAHLHMTSIFLVPLMALVVVRFVEGEVGSRGLAVRLGVLMGLQLLISTEIAFTASLALATALVLAFLFVPTARGAVVSSILPIVASYGVAIVVAAPLVYFALTGFVSEPVNEPHSHTTDLLNLVVPTDRFVLGGHWGKELAVNFAGNNTERDAYIGLPLLAIVVWYAIRRRRSGTTWFLLSCAIVTLLCSFGWWIVADGHRLITGPWEHIGYRPIFNNVLPARLMMFAELAIAVIAALWTASTRGRARIVMPVLAAAALFPNLQLGYLKTSAAVPAFFTGDGVKRCVAPGENVLILPQSKHGNANLEQVLSRFRFRMADGYLVPTPPDSFTSNHTVALVAYHQITWPGLKEFARLKKVTSVLVEADHLGEFRDALKPLEPARLVDGVYVYRFDRKARC